MVEQVLKYLLLILTLMFLATGCSTDEKEVSTDEETIREELSLEVEDSGDA